MVIGISLVFLPTSSTTRILLLRAKPRVPPKRKDVEPGSVKGEANNSLVALVGKQVPGIALPCYFPKSADALTGLTETSSAIFVAGYINPHSQSFGSLAGKSPKVRPCLRYPVCEPPSMDPERYSPTGNTPGCKFLNPRRMVSWSCSRQNSSL
ncbi:hypothetical protein OUZ56_025817 [Daphnia magna]|uniref:Uncharacterized protein n=1 Tax=Daphnia magna TaxID=35525 RepID=A0ABQ9ZKC5_9CRUS|nr:hypothetical protein OUZ56_025817 [Daphnia magna]